MEGGALVSDCKVTQKLDFGKPLLVPLQGCAGEASDHEHDADAAGRAEEDAVSRLI